MGFAGKLGVPSSRKDLNDPLTAVSGIFAFWAKPLAAEAQFGASPFLRNQRVAVDNFAVGHYCRICHRHRANERFSGKGHRDHICKECKRLPHATRKHVEEVDEILGFLTQSHISAKNLERLKILAESGDEEVACLARVVREMAEIRPYKRKRLRFLAKEPQGPLCAT